MYQTTAGSRDVSCCYVSMTYFAKAKASIATGTVAKGPQQLPSLERVTVRLHQGLLGL